ncbi:MAG: MarR family winged helix-turn-helix transcriptional regulator [Nocardioidaceae bacterium]
MATETSKPVRSDGGLATALRSSVMRLSRRLRSERDPADDFTASQLAVLGHLHRDGRLTLGELAAAEKVQPPSMTRIVNALHERGLVRRSPHETDGRLVLLSLTETAESVLREARRRKEEWLNCRLRELTSDERRTLRAAAPILERLSHA